VTCLVENVRELSLLTPTLPRIPMREQFLHQITAIVPLLLLAPHDVREGAYYTEACEGTHSLVRK
jgi:hypothetical protein